MLRIVDKKILKTTQLEARTSPRRRANYQLHQPEDCLQRMLQVVYHDTYFAPHKHAKKLESFVMLKGKMAVVGFSDQGKINELAILGEDTYMAEIVPGTWHSVIVLSKSAAFIEIIEGHYDPLTHKIFAPWAPAENTPSAAAYLELLQKQIG